MVPKKKTIFDEEVQTLTSGGNSTSTVLCATEHCADLQGISIIYYRNEFLPITNSFNSTSTSESFAEETTPCLPVPKIQEQPDSQKIRVHEFETARSIDDKTEELLMLRSLENTADKSTWEHDKVLKLLQEALHANRRLTEEEFKQVALGVVEKTRLSSPRVIQILEMFITNGSIQKTDLPYLWKEFLSESLPGCCRLIRGKFVEDTIIERQQNKEIPSLTYNPSRVR